MTERPSQYCNGTRCCNLTDELVTLNTTFQHATSSKHYQDLILVPCILLWLMTPVYAVYVARRPAYHFWTSCSKLGASKLTAVVVLTLMNFYRLIREILNWENGSMALIHTFPTILVIVTYILVMVYIQWIFRKGLHTSLPLFVFWFLLLAVEFIIVVFKACPSFTLACVELALITLEFTLACISDTAALENDLNSRGEKTRLLSAVDQMTRVKNNPCPKEKASILSLALFTWFIPTLIRGFKRPHTVSSLWNTMDQHSAEVTFSKLDKEWQKELAKGPDESKIPNADVSDQETCGELRHQRGEPSLGWALAKAFLSDVCTDVLFMAGFIATSFLRPILLRCLIRFIEENNPLATKGYTLAVAFSIVCYASNLFMEHHFDTTGTAAIKISNALIGAIYRKALRTTNGGDQHMGVGYVVNMVSVDVDTLVFATDYLSFLWATPVIITVGMVLLWQQLGPSCLAGLVFLLFIFPASSLIVARKLEETQKDVMKLKEKRLNLTSQVLNGIRVIKLYAWESYFKRNLKQIRDQEVHHLRKANLLSSASLSWQISPVLVMLVCFVTYTLSSKDHVLDAEKTFVSIAIGNAMYYSLGGFINAMNYAVLSLVSLGRIREYLLDKELGRPPDHCATLRHRKFPIVNHFSAESHKDLSVAVQDGTFAWTKEPCLSNIDVKIKRGMLVAVVGKVGSGKSSLLSALLGEMKRLSGSVSIQGSVAYVPQEAWIQNLTLQDNILLSSKMNESKYETILDACALRPDLRAIPCGDLAEIGEKGINLSGGQKQRVSLARAVYSDRDIYLLDDPLSAVDAHVGKHIFDNVIGPGGILKDKTRVLVTHGIRHLPYVDGIILMKEGRISGIGSLHELSDTEDFVECVTSANSGENGGGTEKDEQTYDANQSHNGKKTKPNQSSEMKQLVAEEEVVSGQVEFFSIVAYLTKEAGCVFPSMLVVCMVLFTTSQCLTQLWLRRWSQDQPVNGTQDETTVFLRIGVFGGLAIFQVLSYLSIATAITCGGMVASSNLHSKLSHSIFRSPMSFFDTTPMGRILSRFSGDLDSVDQRIPFTAQAFVRGILQVVSAAIVVVVSVPVCLAIIIPWVAILVIIKKIFATTACQLQRIEVVSRSPIYAFLGESIQGRSSIRAFSKQEQFITRMDGLLNTCASAWFHVITASRSLTAIVLLLGNILPGMTAILGLVLNLDPSTLGMIVSFTMQVGSMLSSCMCRMAYLEVQSVSVERIREYSELESEAPPEVPGAEPPKSWPEEGVVEFKHFKTRYRPGLELALKGISCRIRPGEKVGVVGRTGAGKSSLTLALFRMIEAESGAIEIDGRNIGRMGLHDVRKRMSIIPQDPAVFPGTLQFNLDPSGTHCEHDMWQALELAHLKTFVATLPDGLQHECGDNGGNLSVGQRQLICLARALLHKSKILVLDEATAAVDMDTDELIQSTIRTEFKNCTVITIAHRLNTIMDYDRILVMDDGYIKEFDSPENLVANSNGIFYALAKEANVLGLNK